MIDFHSHILPNMDDGSSSLRESLSMLDLLSQQGMDLVVATPHFYANDNSVDEFLDRRRRSAEALLTVLRPEHPEIRLGAEVRYYEGISRNPDLKKLRIESTRLLLLEMPFARWTEYTVRELTDLSLSSTVLVLAHVERYLGFQPSSVIDRLLGSGILLQINASYLNHRFTRSGALGMLGRQQVHFLGSDCHNLTDRAPEIGKAYGLIEKKFGSEFLSDFADYGNHWFL